MNVRDAAVRTRTAAAKGAVQIATHLPRRRWALHATPEIREHFVEEFARIYNEKQERFWTRQGAAWTAATYYGRLPCHFDIVEIE